MFSHKEDMSEYAAELFAMICVDGETTSALVDILRELTDNVVNKVYKETIYLHLVFYNLEK